MKKVIFPSYFKKYFWEIDLKTLDPTNNAPYIVSRLFEYGDFPALRWIKEHYSKRKIFNILRTSRTLSPRTKYFWSCYFRHN